MPKFNWVLSTLLVSAAIASGLPTQSMQSAVAQINSPQSWAAIFENVFNQQNPPQDNNPTADSSGPAAGRPVIARVCALTPSPIGTNAEIWSDRPLFVWRGLRNVGKQIEVRLPGSQEALWYQEVPVGTGIRRVMYDGEKPLQPGQTYNWVVINQANQEFEFSNLNYVKSVTFKVMDAQKRDRIKADLTRLEEELKNKRATPEEIALQRANYFAQRQLWWDVLQEVYSVKNPSAALEEVVKSIPNEICTPRASRPNAVLSH
jgi:hypothetical protein